jgi:uncharacterized membrane protein SpoIIM required for sporulation
MEKKVAKAYENATKTPSNWAFVLTISVVITALFAAAFFTMNSATIFAANPAPGATPPTTQEFGKTLAGRIIKDRIFPVLILFGVVWAIWIGIQFATADGEGKRTAAKKRLVTALASVLIIVICYLIMMGLGEIEITKNDPVDMTE